ncbi:hypothetical protein [uncultured Acetobacteroides sp.]|uniref:hypothetical protein n=1 Tax=uncultured Acetobacteroides sp. TaxID=1760811 RepID=UPI0029F5969A|nr:hypothetical protein [uncultured Acetobacteroides sp.]
MPLIAQLLFVTLLALCKSGAAAVKTLPVDKHARATSTGIRMTYYKPGKGSVPTKEAKLLNAQYPNKGEITLLINVATPHQGCYVFLFKEKIISETHHGGDSSDVYGTLPNGTFGVVRRDYNEPYTTTIKNLYGYILAEDHGGYVEKRKFQDFGNEVYFPEFLYDYCLVDDADGNGDPEFYLTYFGLSDGLDAKPLKVIVYSSSCPKAKATAYYPGGNEDDVYYVTYDDSWSMLPKKIQQRANAIIKEVKDKGLIDI